MKNIYLLGYMGSGKSTIGPLLATQLSYDFIDFDDYIEEQEQDSISNIFKSKGEIYFRKVEFIHLRALLKEEIDTPRVIALGGGTPCYGNNMELLKKAAVKTVYINIPFQELSNRLWSAREKRPLISAMDSYEQLEDYIRKHLFERGFYYNQADLVVKVGEETPEKTVEAMIAQLF